MDKDIILRIYNAFADGAIVCTDTRTIEKGAVYFALKGENFNGNRFAQQALDAGAKLVIVDEETSSNDNRVIRVDDVLSTLQQLATHHRRQFTIPFIAITGSNGKTTTKELISKVLSEKYETHYTRGNLNNHIGVPLTLLELTHRHEIAVIEMGANHRGEIRDLCKIAEPDFVLITNVGKAHLEGFGGFEGVKAGKGEMYDYARQNDKLVFINEDNIILKDMLGNWNKTYTYGTGAECDISGSITTESPCLGIKWKEKTKDEFLTATTLLTGHYNFENILSAVAVGTYFKIAPAGINKALASYNPDNQRSQQLKIGTNHIILDAYNANPTSMEAALANFNRNFKGKKAVFIGEMLELGNDSIIEHRKIVDMLKACNFDMVLLVGKNFIDVASGTGFEVVLNSKDAADRIWEMNPSDYNILIKGSRGTKMEKVLEALYKKQA